MAYFSCESTVLKYCEEFGLPFVDYLRFPFASTTRAFEGGYHIVNDYDPTHMAGNQIALADGMQNAYECTKIPQPRSEGDPEDIDLATPYSVCGMTHHLIAHAVTGDVRHGVSSTRIIPYWDRESVARGLEHTTPDLAERTYQLEVIDGLCINILRTLARHYVDRIASGDTGSPEEHERNAVRIGTAMLKGQRSKESPLTEQMATLQIELRAAAGDVDEAAIGQIDRVNAIAKIKQLLWLVDQQRSSRVRGVLVHELIELTDNALAVGITEEELMLDMGADTGISQATHRPLYVISDFVQLQHLGADTYALPQKRCHQIPLQDLLESIDRPSDGLPVYESDGRYRLPFHFERRQIPRQVPRSLTGLLVQL